MMKNCLVTTAFRPYLWCAERKTRASNWCSYAKIPTAVADALSLRFVRVLSQLVLRREQTVIRLQSQPCSGLHRWPPCSSIEDEPSRLLDRLRRYRPPARKWSIQTGRLTSLMFRARVTALASRARLQKFRGKQAPRRHSIRREMKTECERNARKMVGANGFEPSTSWSRTRRASQAALRPDMQRTGAQDALVATEKKNSTQEDAGQPRAAQPTLLLGLKFKK